MRLILNILSSAAILVITAYSIIAAAFIVYDQVSPPADARFAMGVGMALVMALLALFCTWARGWWIGPVIAALGYMLIGQTLAPGL